MEHPTVTAIRSTGYPQKEETIYGTDALENIVMSGDEILCIHDTYFLVHALEPMAIEVLEELGATYAFAK